MEIHELAVRDAFRIVPEPLPDARGRFYESLRQAELTEAVGHPFRLAQVNHSVSVRGTLRGIHGVALPSGQAKIVSCVRGAVLDVVVDIRLGSPTFGAHGSTVLDEESGTSVYVAEGLGHAFLALTEGACVSYLCSTPYRPGTPYEINALDPDLALPWGLSAPPLMSAKDAGAPGLAEAAATGLLPSYQECLGLYEALRAQV